MFMSALGQWGTMLHNTRNGFGSERNEVDPADMLDIHR